MLTLHVLSMKVHTKGGNLFVSKTSWIFFQPNQSLSPAAFFTIKKFPFPPTRSPTARGRGKHKRETEVHKTKHSTKIYFTIKKIAFANSTLQLCCRVSSAPPRPQCRLAPPTCFIFTSSFSNYKFPLCPTAALNWPQLSPYVMMSQTINNFVHHTHTHTFQLQIT